MKRIHNILISIITALLFIVAQPAIADSDTGVDDATSNATDEVMSNPTIDDLLAQINRLSKDELRDFKKAIRSALGMKKKKAKKKNSQSQEGYKKNKCKNKKNQAQAKNNRCKCKNKENSTLGYHKISSARQMNDGHGFWKGNSTFKARNKCKGKKSKMQWSRSSSMGHGDRMHHRGFMKSFHGMRGMNQHQHHYGGHWPNANPWGWGRYQ